MQATNDPDSTAPDAWSGQEPGGLPVSGRPMGPGPEPQAPPPRTVRTAVARVISEVFQPPFTVGAVLLLSPAASPGWPGTWWYGALAVLFVCVLPFAILLVLVRAGRVVDHHVSERAQRAPVLLMSLACIAAGIVLLAALGAPASVLAMVVALVAGVAVMALVSLWWKISGHSASVATAAVALPVILGPEWWGALAVVPLVGWARVTLGAHTLGEVLAGIATGPLIMVGLWRLLLAG